MPTEPKVTKYEVGTPTSINLENPTVLTPANVFVDDYKNLDSLVIKNMPGTKSYTTFNKIATNYGGYMIPGMGLHYDTGEVDPNETRRASTPIPVSPGDVIAVTGTESAIMWCYIVEYDSSNTKLRHYGIGTTNTIGSGTSYIRLGIHNPSHVVVTNITTGRKIFDWSA
jgi:hypothetical protein